MLVVRPKFAIISLLAILLALVTPVYAAQRHSGRKRPVKHEQPAPTPPPVVPPVLLTLEQMPSSLPQVAFHNGQLTIVAENSTLGDILRAVHTQTGAAVDVPANATERVVSHLGPGPARDVLAALLNGSHFNYVMLGSLADPRALERVILTPKSGSGQDSAALQANAVSQPASQPVYTQAEPPIGTPPGQEADDLSNDDFSDDIGEVDTQPDGQGAPADEQQVQQQPNGQQNVKSPEQLLQELQRQQRRLQGLPEGLPPQPGQPPQAPPPPQ
jgi:hypothetical protein